MGRTKKPDGIRMNSRGVLVEKRGTVTRLYWGEQKKRDFQKAFPYDTNENLAVRFGCCVRTVVRRAREMGLEKNPQWLAAVWDKNRQQAYFVMKLPSTPKADLTNFIENGKRTRFKPGVSSHNNLTHEQQQELHRKSWETRRKRYGATGTKGKYGKREKL